MGKLLCKVPVDSYNSDITDKSSLGSGIFCINLFLVNYFALNLDLSNCSKKILDISPNSGENLYIFQSENTTTNYSYGG